MTGFQMGLNGIQEVVGSIPFSSTTRTQAAMSKDMAAFFVVAECSLNVSVSDVLNYRGRCLGYLGADDTPPLKG